MPDMQIYGHYMHIR